jgi:hypothetical protein
MRSFFLFFHCEINKSLLFNYIQSYRLIKMRSERDRKENLFLELINKSV